MRVLVLSCLALVACGDLDTRGTAFRCDDTRGCPGDQTCVFGRCRRGGATGEVGCGAVTCTTMEQCCVDTVNAPRCIPAGDVCPGRSALCDGREDCQAGDLCCHKELTVCQESCADDGVACTSNDDCPSDQPNCCPFNELPWGLCFFGECDQVR